MIDFHSHSNASDGTYTPLQLAEKAESLGISHFALTDHDTVNGLDKFLSFSSNKIKLIPGIEISANFTGGELHIVGLFINRNSPDLLKMLNELQARRQERNEKLIKNLSSFVKKSVKITDLIEDASAQLGRPHIAKYLVKNGFCNTIQEAFDKYLADGCPLSAPRRHIDMQDAFDVIRASGGVVVLAHPSTLNLSDNELDEFIASCKIKGLDAVEAFSSHSPAEKKDTYKEIAEKNGLALSCGSDFHGGNSKVPNPGADIGKMNDMEIIAPLYEIAKKRGWKE